LWSPALDLATFGGSAALAIAIAVAGRALGLADGPMPEWSWVVFVLAIDVAHVWSTLFRTYLDRAEIARRRPLYVGLPLVLWASGGLLHAFSPLGFWRALAYLAVFHFVRQQVGWVAIYRARSGERSRVDKWIDDAAVYASTGVPLLIWHASLPRPFTWFVRGDFVGAPQLAALVPAAKASLAVALTVFVLRQVQRALSERAVNVGKIVVVLSTAAIWWFGIVTTGSDFEFTVTNVVVHGVPYLVLLWQYARFRAAEAPRAAGSRIIQHGIGVFLGVLLALAFVEELFWDRLVWHDRPWLFGGGDSLGIAGGAHAMPEASSLLMAVVVSLLAVPQATHYALDAFLWRRRDTGPAQARALGFQRSPTAE
jgi:hypothetical protein